MASSLNSSILIPLAIDDWKSIEDNQGGVDNQLSVYDFVKGISDYS